MGKALMVIVVGFTSIFGGIIFNISSSQQIISSDIYDIHSQWIANNNLESINNVVISKIYQGTAALTDTFYLEDSKGYFRVVDMNADSVNEAELARVETITEYQGEKDTISTVFMEPAYSYYQYFMDDWNGNVTHTTGDTIWGPLHSNKQIEISGSPVYMSKVSSDEDPGFNAGGALILGGVEFGMNEIPLPDDAMLQPLADTIQAKPGKIFADDTWILFNNDGTFSHRANSAGPPWDATEALTTYFGLLMSTGGKDLHVEGTVNGRVTVYSDDHLYIEDNLTYASNPLIVPTSDDYIGLVARNKITVVYNFSFGFTTRTIYGALLSKNDLEIDNSSSLLLRLNIIGSLVAKNDKFTASDAGVFSLNKTHTQDTRLRTNCPPYFPRVPNRQEVIYRSN